MAEHLSQRKIAQLLLVWYGEESAYKAKIRSARSICDVGGGDELDECCRRVSLSARVWGVKRAVGMTCMPAAIAIAEVAPTMATAYMSVKSEGTHIGKAGCSILPASKEGTGAHNVQ